MASWNTYVDQVKTCQGVECTALFDGSGNIYAKNGDFDATNEEIKSMTGLMAGSRAGKGIYVNGKKYMFQREVDDNTTTYLSTDSIVGNEKRGIVASFSGKLCLVAKCKVNMLPPTAAETGRLSDYLRSTGY